MVDSLWLMVDSLWLMVDSLWLMVDLLWLMVDLLWLMVILHGFVVFSWIVPPPEIGLHLNSLILLFVYGPVAISHKLLISQLLLITSNITGNQVIVKERY